MLAWRIACRYLFSSKSHHAINAITVVAACGVGLITMVLICILSVYNGFEWLANQQYSHFDADLKVVPTTGKTFDRNDSLYHLITTHPGVTSVSSVLEEQVLLCYGNRQVPAIIKGVDDTYRNTIDIDSVILGGEFLLEDPVVHYTVMGAGTAMQVGIGVGFVRPLTIYCPRREGNISLLNPGDAFTQGELYCSAIFQTNTDYDNELCITSLTFVRTLLQDSLLTSGYEVRLNSQSDPEEIREELTALLPQSFTILTRAEQQADIYRIMNIEKWITFLIVIFILLIASFNIIGALSMLIIDKEAEITTLRNLGADHQLIARIFTFEGWLISGSGAIIGAVVGVCLCLIQQHYGLITLGDGSDMYIIHAYPVVVRWTDVTYSLVSVALIGFLATIYPVRILRTRTTR